MKKETTGPLWKRSRHLGGGRGGMQLYRESWRVSLSRSYPRIRALLHNQYKGRENRVSATGMAVV